MKLSEGRGEHALPWQEAKESEFVDAADGGLDHGLNEGRWMEVFRTFGGGATNIQTM